MNAQPASDPVPAVSSGLTSSVRSSIGERFRAHPPEGPAAPLLADLVAEAMPLASPAVRAVAVADLLAELVGLGALERFVSDPAVTDVLVTGDGRVWVDRHGRVTPTDTRLTATEVDVIVERAVRHSDVPVDRAHPIGEARLERGARLAVVLPPVSPDGVQIAIRTFPPTSVRLDSFGPSSVVDLVAGLVRDRRNLVVYGPTGAGKTTLVGALSRAIDPEERVVTIEDAAELRLEVPHVVRLEARPANGDGAGGVTMTALVRAALRLRPDRIIVGEVRGAEALDMVWAMSTGHDGSLSTIHARSARDALARLETFVLMADADLPLPAVRSQIVGAVDAVVGVRRHGAERSISAVHQVVERNGRYVLAAAYEAAGRSDPEQSP